MAEPVAVLATTGLVFARVGALVLGMPVFSADGVPKAIPVFAALGGWAGWRLTHRKDAGGFQKNDAAIRSLGISAREFETLELLANGLSNKEIARELGVSPNTVKTHLARLYEKLGAARRTEAVGKARDLALIP